MTKLRVLVVDDDLVDRLSVRRALRTAGFEAEVDDAECRVDALAKLSSGEYDCTFLDFLLPDGNGLDVIREAREAGVRSPIIVLTGQGDERTAVELMKAGAADYLPKSEVSPERLTHALHNAIRLYHAERSAHAAERERSRALKLERHAREEAVAAQRRLAFLAEASAIVSASLDYQETLENVARICVPELAEWCLLDLVEAGGGHERVAVAHADTAHAPIAARLRRRYEARLDATYGVTRVIATGRSEIMREVPDWVLVELANDGDHLDALREIGAKSVMTVPLVARGRTLGAMSFLSKAPARYGLDDLTFAEEIARRAALAVDNARLYDEVRRAESRLRQQLDLTTAITGSLAEGVLAVDRDGRFTFANAAAESILGLRGGALLGREVDRVLAPGRRNAIMDAIFAGGVLHAEDDAFVREDGRLVPVSFAASPLFAEDKVCGAVLAFHDITERKRAQAEIEASRRQLVQTEKLSALGTLISGVAHELRTPLTYLTNNMFLLQARLDAAAKADPSLAPLVADARRFSASALEGADRINALVRDLRPFAKTDTGRRVEAGLHEVVEGAVDLFRATQRGRVEVVADLAPTRPIPLDRGQVQRVVLNLLLNGSEAMPKGGRVRVATRDAADGAEVEVEDEGIGMTPEVEERMFDPFFTTKPEGTGLGLAITRRIVEAHGGTLRYSTAPGRGTIFIVRLPAGQPGAGIPVLADAPRAMSTHPGTTS
ncbi:MAG TPA: ATP-binding protein [Candidatus Thermoplasmatota archaeon]|nr:ATP-binding protein [Candidatus Thermoplasmatota archaeon]